MAIPVTASPQLCNHVRHTDAGKTNAPYEQQILSGSGCYTSGFCDAYMS